jgi:hypothetical protein
MESHAVMVHVGMTAFDGDCPAVCTPIEGGTPVNCYMTKELADTVESHHPVAFWAEWNGISYDLIKRMTNDELSVELEKSKVPNNG